jgi:hypothetical protein
VDSDFDEKGNILAWASSCRMAPPPEQLGSVEEAEEDLEGEDEEGMEEEDEEGLEE